MESILKDIEGHPLFRTPSNGRPPVREMTLEAYQLRASRGTLPNIRTIRIIDMNPSLEITRMKFAGRIIELTKERKEHKNAWSRIINSMRTLAAPFLN